MSRVRVWSRECHVRCARVRKPASYVNIYTIRHLDRESENVFIYIAGYAEIWNSIQVSIRTQAQAVPALLIVEGLSQACFLVISKNLFIAAVVHKSMWLFFIDTGFIAFKWPGSLTTLWNNMLVPPLCSSIRTRHPLGHLCSGLACFHFLGQVPRPSRVKTTVCSSCEAGTRGPSSLAVFIFAFDIKIEIGVTAVV